MRGVGVSEFDAISKSYGLATALLIFACLGLLYAVRTLYRENQLLHGRLEQLTEQRSRALDSLMAEMAGDKQPGHPPA